MKDHLYVLHFFYQSILKSREESGLVLKDEKKL